MTPPADLVLADDCLWAGVLLPEFLPQVATDLLVQGVDTPALSQVAGLDLWPFDPRDALDRWNQAVDEAGVPTHRRRFGSLVPPKSSPRPLSSKHCRYETCSSASTAWRSPLAIPTTTTSSGSIA